MSASADAVATARRAGDHLALVHALEARHFALWGQSGPAERLALADEILQSAGAINNVDLVMHGHNLRINDLLELGRIDEVDAAIATYGRLADELRQPSYHWGLGMCRAMRALMEGRFTDAEKLATAALALGQRVQAQTAANFFAAQLFFLRREQGRLGELEDALHGAIATFPTVPGWRCALAGLYAESDRVADAERELALVAANGFLDLPRDNTWLVAATLLAEVCVALQDQRCARLLYDQLLPYDGQVVVAGIAAACAGAVARPLALLAATLQRWDDAAGHFDRALALHQQLRAFPLVARTQCEYAAMLLGAAAFGGGDREQLRSQALALLDASQRTAGTLGMAGLAARTRALLDGVAAAAAQAPRAAAEAPLDGAEENAFRREGDHWTLVFAGRVCRLRDAKGLSYMEQLLREPHRPMHVAELNRVRLGQAHITPGRERARDLQVQLAEAEQFNDLGAAARLRAEIDVVSGSLAREMGIDSDREANADRLRLRVTKAIKAALQKIAAQHPALGHHLQSTIRTGTFCSYTPDPTKPIRWR